MIFSEDGLHSPRMTEKAECGCVALIFNAGGPGRPLGPGGPTGPAEKKKEQITSKCSPNVEYITGV